MGFGDVRGFGGGGRRFGDIRGLNGGAGRSFGGDGEEKVSGTFKGRKGVRNLYVSRGRPRGRRVLSKPRRLAVCSTHSQSPKGRPRRMLCRNAASSAVVCGCCTQRTQCRWSFNRATLIARLSCQDHAGFAATDLTIANRESARPASPVADYARHSGKA